MEICLFSESDCGGHRGIPGLPAWHPDAVGVYLARHDHSRHHPHYRGVLFQAHGTGVCGCNLENLERLATDTRGRTQIEIASFAQNNRIKLVV